MTIRSLTFVAALSAAVLADAAEIPAFHPTVEAALAQAHAVLVERFLPADGLLLDYVGELPTPKDCAEGRPNAIGWWSPIENGPMFTGPDLAAMCEKARRGGAAAVDRALCAKLARGLVKAASVSDVPGMIVRGFGSDGRCHYPLGSEDQTLPWYFGLHAYVRSGLPDADEKAAIVAKMREVTDAIVAAGWGCPCDGRFKGQFRGRLLRTERAGLVFRDVSHYLFVLRAMADVTGDAVWRGRYEKACGEVYADTGMTRLEVCAKGYVSDFGKFDVEPSGMWIYVCAQGCLRALADGETDAWRRRFFLAGLKVNAVRASKFFGDAAKYDNSTERPFKYANWRTGYRWEDQPTQKIAEKVANTGDRTILGTRKGFERRWMTSPLACCAVAAFDRDESRREAISSVIRHYDYSTLNVSEFFFAEVAWYALPVPSGK